MSTNSDAASVPQWRRWQASLTSSRTYENPFQDVALEAFFRAPSGKTHRVDGFWDGGNTWRVRFMPDEIGTWSWETNCSDAANSGLAVRGTFECAAPLNETRFDQHGAIRVAANKRYLEHADGTPFFWLADTVWNGPLLSDAAEWKVYVETRAQQKFSAAQWVTTQWIASPKGDRDGRLAYMGLERIQLSPEFFQRLDEKVDALNRAGILSVPVLLWAARWMRVYSDNAVNPGLSLPEDQAIRLVRYMVARWGANHVLWILNGDGHYEGEAAERWRKIGRGVFGEREHAPVSLHPGGWRWDGQEFASETWLDIWGYQSAHKVDEAGLGWLVRGEPATEWNTPPIHPVINLEPPYEDHNDMSEPDTRRISAHDVRRALYTSLLIAPTAGVSYGGHGVWGWDDGSQPPTAHPKTGVPKPWREALHLPAADQVRYVSDFFGGIEWWNLRPSPELVVTQPGNDKPSATIAAAQTEDGTLGVVYTPVVREVELNLILLNENVRAQWFNPLNGERQTAPYTGTRERACFETPDAGDWVLLLQ